MATFVTCVYNGIDGSPFFGAKGRDRRYLFSLINLAQNMPGEFICYSTEEDSGRLLELGNHHSITNLRVLPTTLDENPLHPRFLEIRQNNPNEYIYNDAWSTRSTEIMSGKFFWLREQATKLDPDEHIFWIDAGISHGGIIPRKYSSGGIGDEITDDDSLFNAHNMDLLFNAALVDGLCRASADKIIVIGCTTAQHEFPLSIDERPASGNISVIGGLFGGRSSHVIAYCDLVLRLFELSAHRGVLLKEEQIMTYIYDRNQFSSYTPVFDTWYHDDWHFFDGSQRPFYKILEDIQCI